MTGDRFDLCPTCGHYRSEHADTDPMTADLWHRPIPGPLYWDFRCLVCSEPVALHPGLIARLRRRWAARRAR